MPTRRQRTKVVNVRCNQTLLRANQLVIDPDRRSPMRPLESEDSASPHHETRVYVALIPGRAEIMTQRLRQERHFDFPGLSVGFVIFTQIPEAIVKRQHPRRVGVDLVAKVLRLKNAGQSDSIPEIAFEPFLPQASVSRVCFKTPEALERDWVGL